MFFASYFKRLCGVIKHRLVYFEARTLVVRVIRASCWWRGTSAQWNVSFYSLRVVIAWILHQAIDISVLWRGNVWCKGFILTHADWLWKKSVCFSMLIHSMHCPGLMWTAVCHRLLWPGGGERARLFNNVLTMSCALLLISNISAWLYSIHLFLSRSLFLHSNCNMSHGFFLLFSRAERSASWIIPAWGP